MTYAIPEQPAVPTLLWDEKGRRWENDKTHGDRWWVCLDKRADSYPSDCAWIDLLQRHGPLSAEHPARCFFYVWFGDKPDGSADDERCLLGWGHAGHHKLNEARWNQP